LNLPVRVSRRQTAHKVMRVHELAKELGVSSKELIGKLHGLGVEAKSHMSALDDEAVLLMREDAGGSKSAAAAKPVPAAKPDTPVAPSEPSASEKQAAVSVEPEDKPKALVSEKDGNTIKVRGAIVVKEFAELLGMRPNELIAELMGMGIFVSINQRVEVNVAKQIAEKHGLELQHEKKVEEHKHALGKKQMAPPEEDDGDRPEDLLPRPPVIVFLGHVDHGKTSLLDKVRNTAVADGEHGGITQHIGAYTVEISGRQITFLDTPGHEAFTAMRARGADLTDIAVIVIAADDGIMPQTKEAIMHAKAAGVAILVAINKTDLPGVNIDQVKKELQGIDLTPEDWGGETICCCVSAKTGDGVEHLLEMILLQADLMELKANPARKARGFVVEASLEPGMGPTANLLVINGTLEVGDTILCAEHVGRVRALINDHGIKVKSAKPSTPVRCLGLSGVPVAGAAFKVYGSEASARLLASEAKARSREELLSVPKRASLDDLYARLQQSETKELKIIVKADTQGSVEAIAHALGDIQSSKVSLNTILSATGNITGNDVMLASASNAVILGFHVAREVGVDSQARHEGVEVRLHNVIYELIDEVRDAMTGMLAPKIQQNALGEALIKQVFGVGKTGKVAGCLVTKGNVKPSYKVKVRRGDEVLYEGSLVSLKHFQDSVAEVRESQECGIHLDGFLDFAEGDILEFYELEEVTQTL
jgi:translation initiation factor IF-2